MRPEQREHIMQAASRADPSRWPDEARHEWQERAAIMEHLGGLPRERAEREAERLVRDRWAREER